MDAQTLVREQPWSIEVPIAFREVYLPLQAPLLYMQLQYTESPGYFVRMTSMYPLWPSTSSLARREEA